MTETNAIDRWAASQKKQVETFNVRAGIRLVTDGRLEKGGTFERLETCEHWAAADFVLPGQNGIPSLACNVKITGRVIRYNAPGLGNSPAIRVRVTFPGDGEPDSVVGGWILAADRERPAS